MRSLMRSSEIQHFSSVLAALTVAAAQAEDAERLAEVQREIEETFIDVFALLAHDALPDRPTALAADLLARVVSRDGAQA